MTPEEKAKRYDEALEKARNIVNSINVGLIGKDSFEAVFPELKESEDEIIISALKSGFKLLESKYKLKGLGGIKFKYILAWLEKQGEQKPNPCDGCINRKGCINCENGELRETEQKPADKVEPKFKAGDTMRTLQEVTNGYTDGMPVVVSIDKEYYHCTNELIPIKDQDDYEYPPMNRRQNPAKWSDEDEGFLDLLLAIFTNEHPDGVFSSGNITVFKGNCVTSNRIIAWLISLKERVQLQSQWKPSDEQMDTLLSEVNAWTKGCLKRIVLESLYNDLKKLKE